MPTFAVLTRWLSAGSLLLHLLLLLRMQKLGLRRTFRWFFSFLAIEAVLLSCLFVLHARQSYAYTYIILQPVLWVLLMLVQLELYSLILGGYTGIATLARRFTYAALGVSVGISLFTLSADMNFAAHKYPVLLYYTVIHRGLLFSLLLFQVLTTAFLLWFPVALGRNALSHSLIYFFYFLVSGVAIFYRNITGSAVTPQVNVVLMAATIACLAAWMMAFQRAEQEKPARLRPALPLDEERRLLGQLEAINETILRGGRK
jgi:hypothetical protein